MGYQLPAYSDQQLADQYQQLSQWDRIAALLRQLQASGVTKLNTAEQAASEVIRLDPSLRVKGQQWSDFIALVGEILAETKLFKDDAAMSMTASRRQQVVHAMLSMAEPPKAPTKDQTRAKEVVGEILRNSPRHDPIAEEMQLLTPAERKDFEALLERSSKLHRREKSQTFKAFIAIFKSNVEAAEAKKRSF